MTVAVFEIDRQAPESPAHDSGHSKSHARTRRKRKPAGTETNRKPDGPFSDFTSAGFTSAIRFAPLTERIEAIRREFVEIHAPATLHESQLVERLAIAQADLFDARAAWEDRLRWQKSHALELFDRFQRHRFETDLKAWNASPHGMRQVFGQSWHSSGFLCDLWNSVREGLESEFGLHFEQVKHMILAFGGDWRVDRIDGLRGHIMCWFLALIPDPDTFLRQWICASRAKRTGLAAPELDRLRAEAILAAAPSAESAKENLRQLAEKQLSIWSAELEKQRQAYFEERARCEHAASAQALGDAADVRETRRIRRELSKAESQFEKLERRLLTLRKARQNEAQPRFPESRMPGQRIDPDRESPQPAAKSRTSQRAASHAGKSAKLRACTVKSTESRPARDVAQDSTEPRMECVTPVEPVRARPARRQDPASLAKAWRAKQAKQSKCHSGQAAWESRDDTLMEKVQ